MRNVRWKSGDDDYLSWRSRRIREKKSRIKNLYRYLMHTVCVCVCMCGLWPYSRKQSMERTIETDTQCVKYGSRIDSDGRTYDHITWQSNGYYMPFEWDRWKTIASLGCHNSWRQRSSLSFGLVYTWVIIEICLCLSVVRCDRNSHVAICSTGALYGNHFEMNCSLFRGMVNWIPVFRASVFHCRIDTCVFLRYRLCLLHIGGVCCNKRI